MNRALLVGINAYPNSPLKGCVNDITDMAEFLVQKCGFTHEDIRLLTDQRATKDGIVERLGWLINGVRKGDRILFHYSGHGAQMPTRDPAGEVDHLDEVICPVDFDWTDEHAIRDKDFNKMFGNLPEGIEFVWISDSCHSADLTRAVFRNDVRVKMLVPPPDIEWRIQTAREKKLAPMTMIGAASGLNVALISGCKSDQTAEDASFNNRPNGALTYYLLSELGKSSGTNESLISVVQNVNEALKAGRYVQEPQLEGNQDMMNRPFMKL
jgi:hypothetical protein